jgi:uncharacterized protein YbaA (DUF1428 family)
VSSDFTLFAGIRTGLDPRAGDPVLVTRIFQPPCRNAAGSFVVPFVADRGFFQPIQEFEMAYIDGFVIAVPTANRDKFIEHARAMDSIFMEFGATRIVECWGDDVAHGKQTDFFRAVAATEGESVAFSWIEWPDKATRDAGMEAAMNDPRFSPENSPMPFDGARMIYGGFMPVFEINR